jgi:diacylglycerol kinase (ATP)
MSKSIAFIINPASGSGKTKRNLKRIVREIKSHEQSARILLTHHPLHATDLVRNELKHGTERLVVVGGDGTLNEAVNGFFDSQGKHHNPNASLGIVASGTGSDFVRMNDGEETLHTSIAKAIFGEAKPTDIGLVEASDVNQGLVRRYFINVSSLGLSGLVAGFMRTTTRVLGAKSAYFISTVKAINTFRAPSVEVSGPNISTEIIDNVAIMSFANGKFYGGGMKIAPNAEVDDGFFDRITITDLSVWFFLANGHRVYQGTHLELPNVRSERVDECHVKCLDDRAVFIETDGELLGKLPATYWLKANYLNVVR